jgi:hypothetical protein
MGGSAAEAPTSPDALPAGLVRASDAERDEVLGRLRDEFAAGRLSQDTFLFRMDAVLKARHVSDLPALLADLPPGPAAAAAGPDQEVPSAPLPAELVPAQAEQAWPPPTGQVSLITRLRALPRMLRYGTHVGNPGKARGEPQERRPAALEFPRGAGIHFSIGRSAGCDLALADMTVSRVHARLERTDDGWLLTDLESTNGTRVNGWRVRGQVRVRAGDRVSFGSAEFWLSAADGI